MAKVAFHTLGCKVNHYESEAMMDLFKKKVMILLILMKRQMSMWLIPVQ